MNRSITSELTRLGIEVLEPAGLAMIDAEAARFTALLRSMPEGISADDFLLEVGGAFPELRNVLSVRRITDLAGIILIQEIHFHITRIAGGAGQMNRGYNLPANRTAARDALQRVPDNAGWDVAMQVLRDSGE